MPIALAISRPRLYSKPVPFLIVVPDARPFQKPGAGRSKPTMSFPASFVGGDPWADATDAVIAHSASAAASTVRLIATLLVEA